MSRKPKTNADVSRFDCYIYNWPEYWSRLSRTFIYGVVYIALVAAIAAVTTIFIVNSSVAMDIYDTLKGAVSTATGIAQPVEIDNDGVKTYLSEPDDQHNTVEGRDFNEVFFTIYLIEAISIALLGMVFSGWFAKVFLTPINPLKFAPFAILEEDRISFRFWICLPSEVFLNNVSVALEYTYLNRFDSSIIYMNGSSEESGIQNSANPTHIQTESFLRLRGVWRINVLLGTKASSALLESFQRLAEEGKNPLFKLTLQGETDSGEVVTTEKRYSRLRVLPDYRFAVYHSRKSGSSNKPIFRNFCKVEHWKKTNDTPLDTQERAFIKDTVDAKKAKKEYKQWKKLLKQNRMKVEKIDSGKYEKEKHFLQKYTLEETEAYPLRYRIRDWYRTITLGR